VRFTTVALDFKRFSKKAINRGSIGLN